MTKLKQQWDKWCHSLFGVAAHAQLPPSEIRPVVVSLRKSFGYADIVMSRQTQRSQVRVISGNGPYTSTAGGMSNNAVLMDFNTSTQNLGVQVMVRDLDGDGNVEIEALTTQVTSMLLSAYDYNGTLAPTTLVSKTYARLNGASAPVRIG